uniref:Transposase n=1 Tax=Schistocephalus solidus TaxID=70667 RepID=A0A183TP74_SCHSO
LTWFAYFPAYEYNVAAIHPTPLPNQIDLPKECINVSQSCEKLKPEAIADLAPANSGSYHLYRFEHTHEGKQLSTLSDADFHGHRPAVYINQHLLWYLMSVSVRHLNRAFGSSHSASSAYQKWPTWHSHIQRPTPTKRAGHLTHLKFENRLSSFRTQYL